MSFAAGDDVMRCTEAVVRELWRQSQQECKLPETFDKISYDEAISRYGSDKPDVRLGMEVRPSLERRFSRHVTNIPQISKISHLIPADLTSKITSLSSPIVEVMKLSVSDHPQTTRKFISDFFESPAGAPFQQNPDGAPGVFVVDSSKPLQGLQPLGFQAAEHLEELLRVEDGDLIILQSRKDAPITGGFTAIGSLRLALYKAAVAAGHLPPPQGFEFLWVVDFPLFTPTTTNGSDPGQGGAAGLSSSHHPFTSPKSAADVDLLLTDPLRAKADHYDLVVNGVELGGGSRRIHDARVQEFILRDVLKVCQDPPHSTQAIHPI